MSYVNTYVYINILYLFIDTTHSIVPDVPPRMVSLQSLFSCKPDSPRHKYPQRNNKTLREGTRSHVQKLIVVFGVINPLTYLRVATWDAL